MIRSAIDETRKAFDFTDVISAFRTPVMSNPIAEIVSEVNIASRAGDSV